MEELINKGKELLKNKTIHVEWDAGNDNACVWFSIGEYSLTEYLSNHIPQQEAYEFEDILRCGIINTLSLPEATIGYYQVFGKGKMVLENEEFVLDMSQSILGDSENIVDGGNICGYLSDLYFRTLRLEDPITYLPEEESKDLASSLQEVLGNIQDGEYEISIEAERGLEGFDIDIRGVSTGYFFRKLSLDSLRGEFIDAFKEMIQGVLVNYDSIACLSDCDITQVSLEADMSIRNNIYSIENGKITVSYLLKKEEVCGGIVIDLKDAGRCWFR